MRKLSTPFCVLYIEFIHMSTHVATDVENQESEIMEIETKYTK